MGGMKHALHVDNNEKVVEEDLNVVGNTWVVRWITLAIFGWALAGGIVVMVQIVAGCPLEVAGGPNVDANFSGYPDNEYFWTNITEDNKPICALLLGRQFGDLVETAYFSFIAWMLALLVTIDAPRIPPEYKWAPTVVLAVFGIMMAMELYDKQSADSRAGPVSIAFIILLVVLVLFAAFYARDWLHQQTYLRGAHAKSLRRSMRALALPCLVTLAVSIAWSVHANFVAWSARLFVNTSPNQLWCDSSGLGTIASKSPYAADGGASFRLTKCLLAEVFNDTALSECETAAQLNGVDFLSWSSTTDARAGPLGPGMNVGKGLCQHYPSCGNFLTSAHPDTGNWTSFVKCSRVSAKYYMAVLASRKATWLVFAAGWVATTGLALGIRSLLRITKAIESEVNFNALQQSEKLCMRVWTRLQKLLDIVGVTMMLCGCGVLVYQYAMPQILSNAGESIIATFFSEGMGYWDYAARSSDGYYVEVATVFFLGLFLSVVSFPVTVVVDHCRKNSRLTIILHHASEYRKNNSHEPPVPVPIDGRQADWQTVESMLRAAAANREEAGSKADANLRVVVSATNADKPFATFKANVEIAANISILEILSSEWLAVRFLVSKANRNLFETESVLRATEEHLELLLKTIAKNAHGEREKAAVVVQENLAPHKAIYKLQMTSIAHEPQFYVLLDSVSALADDARNNAKRTLTDQNKLVFQRFGHKDWYVAQNAHSQWQQGGLATQRGLRPHRSLNAIVPTTSASTDQPVHPPAYQRRTDHIAAITRILWASKLDRDIFNDFCEQLAQKSGCVFHAAPVKGAYRCLEKVVLKSRAAEWMDVHSNRASASKAPTYYKLRQAAKLQDTLRGMLVVEDSATMLMAINILAACDGSTSQNVLELNEIGSAGRALRGAMPSIEITRVKNRLKNPTDGGWADVMINFKVRKQPDKFADEGRSYWGTKEAAVPGSARDFLGDAFILRKSREAEDTTTLVCELQIVHKKMLQVRTRLGGHHGYGLFRAALETLSYLNDPVVDKIVPQEDPEKSEWPWIERRAEWDVSSRDRKMP